MSCFTRTTHNLRSGVMYQYNLNLGNPANLTTKTHYSASVAEYERILAHIEKYAGQKLNFCPSVDDLAATYNALNEELGLSGRVMDKAGFLNLAKQRDSQVNPQPQGKSAIRRAKSARSSIHQLRGRGVDGGNVFLDVKSIRQRIDNEKRIAEEQRVQAQLNLEIEEIKAETERLKQIEINKQKQKDYDEKIRLEKIESQRLQKIIDNEEIRLAKELQEKARQEEIKRNLIIIPKVVIPEIAPEIIPAVVASSSLIPLGILAILLINSSRGKK